MAGLFTDFDPIKSIAKNQYGMSTKVITRGSLISFDYPRSMAIIPNIIHDPRPMVILTDVWAPNYIRGINLHYLTFPYVKNILQKWSGNPSFNYLNIKGDRYIAGAFRVYHMKGITKPKRLDSEWLQTVLSTVRSFDPSEIERIRTNIKQQIQSRLQIKASELTAYEQWRKNLPISQQRQLNNTVQNISNDVLGGVQKNLINPTNSQPDQTQGI